MPTEPLDSAALKQPMPEAVSAIYGRLKLILIYVAYFIVIGVPLWFYTTSIYQSSLPIEDIKEIEASTKISFDIPIYIKLPKPLRHLTYETQKLIDEELVSLGLDLSEYRLTLYSVSMNDQVSTDNYEVILESTDDDDSVFVDPFGRSAKVFFSKLVVANDKIPDFIMRVIVYNMFQYEISRHHHFSHLMTKQQEHNNLALPYSLHYNLVFSLVVEDGTPHTWTISEAIDEYFKNFVKELSSFTNFTIDTQIQYYCNSDLVLSEENGARILSTKELSTFVDFGGWNLIDLISTDSTINFMIYIPKSPLQIENSTTNSFIIPQWGGVKIYNTEFTNLGKEVLLPMLEQFSSQLLTLLDFPKGPKSLLIRLDMMKRLTIIHNVKKSFENLNSLIKLVQQLLDIPIPEATLDHVQDTLNRIKELSSRGMILNDKLVTSNDAFKFSNAAFFQKDMIQQNYFPQAHKFTIYLPIVGPVILILLNSSLRSILDLRRRNGYVGLQK